MATTRRKPQGRSSPGLTLLLLNVPALAALAVMGVLYLRGDVQLEEVPEGTVRSLGVVAVGLVLLFMVAAFSLPAAHGVARDIERSMVRMRAILAGRKAGSRLASLLALPLLFVAWIPAGLVRLILILISIALIAVIVVFLVRAFVPDFLQDQIQWVLDFRPWE